MKRPGWIVEEFSSRVEVLRGCRQRVEITREQLPMAFSRYAKGSEGPTMRSSNIATFKERVNGFVFLVDQTRVEGRKWGIKVVSHSDLLLTDGAITILIPELRKCEMYVVVEDGERLCRCAAAVVPVLRQSNVLELSYHILFEAQVGEPLQRITRVQLDVGSSRAASCLHRNVARSVPRARLWTCSTRLVLEVPGGELNDIPTIVRGNPADASPRSWLDSPLKDVASLPGCALPPDADGLMIMTRRSAFGDVKDHSLPFVGRSALEVPGVNERVDRALPLDEPPSFVNPEELHDSLYGGFDLLRHPVSP